MLVNYQEGKGKALQKNILKVFAPRGFDARIGEFIIYLFISNLFIVDNFR